jgi:hypothetical protein
MVGSLAVRKLVGLGWKQCEELDWKQCKELRLRMLSIEKECLGRSQSLDAFRECIIHYLLLRGRGA